MKIAEREPPFWLANAKCIWKTKIRDNASAKRKLLEESHFY